MRVIAGTLKGRRLKAPGWEGLRPTSDRLRETIFNILAPRVAGARVLDAYAGTGALGIEALSRGAAAVVFIEDDRRAQALIEENLAHCGIRLRGVAASARRVDRGVAASASHVDGDAAASEGHAYAIIRSAFVRGIASLRADPAFAPFDIILLDPPYDQSPEAILATASTVVAAGGIVVYEHSRRQTTPVSVASMRRFRTVRSGDSMLSLYDSPGI
jgi:16S rRNA G966 N2-methylase RsmD